MGGASWQSIFSITASRRSLRTTICSASWLPPSASGPWGFRPACLAALVAAAIEPEGIGSLSLNDSYASLKEIIEKNTAVNTAPELFCFGLLEKFDVKQIAALAMAPAPGASSARTISFHDPNERVKRELSGLDAWKELLAK
jgi:hypothetical protein